MGKPEGFLAALFALLVQVSAALATTLTWDGNPGIIGLQDGGGGWNTGDVNRWFNGSSYQFWNNANNDTAVFGVTNFAAGVVRLESEIRVGNIIFNPPGATNYSIRHSGSTSNTLTLAGKPTITATADATIDATIAGVAFTKEGDATLTLRGTGSYPNTYAGTTVVNAGTLLLAKSASIISIPGNLVINSNATVRLFQQEQIANGAIVILNGGTVDMTAFNEVVGGVVLNGGAIVGSGGTLSNSVSDFDVRSGSINAPLGGAAGLAKSTSDTVILGSTNTYSGNTMIYQGTLRLDNDLALPAGAGKGNVNVNGVLDINGHGIRINGLSGYGVVTSSNPGPAVLTVGSNNATSSFSGMIADGEGAVALSKMGNGVLTLDGVNTCSGDTIIAAGTLALGSFGSIGNSATIQVSAGATLDVSGRVDGTLTLASGQTLNGSGVITGEVAAAAGSRITPGSSLGALTINGALTLQDGSHTVMELNRAAGTNDFIGGLIGVSYGGTLTVTNLGGALELDDRFKLFDAGSYTNAFDTINLPALPAGLRWTNHLAVDGTIAIIASSQLVIHRITPVPAGMELTFSGLAGQDYRLWAGTNLVLMPVTNSWKLLTNGTLGWGLEKFTDGETTNHPRKFYLLTAP